MSHMVSIQSMATLCSAANTCVLSLVSTQNAAMLSLGQLSVNAGKMEMHSDRRMIFLSSFLVFSLDPLPEPPLAFAPPPEGESKNSRRAMPFWLAGYRTNQFFFHF